MIFHLMFACWGFIAPFVLHQMRTKAAFRPRAAYAVGAVSGLACGAGLALGGFFQSTTAYIDSGYSFASIGEWLGLAFTGGIVGVVAGLALARLARIWRPAVAVFALLAVVSTAGWIVAAARPEIDCEDNQSFCEQRYGYGLHRMDAPMAAAARTAPRNTNGAVTSSRRFCTVTSFGRSAKTLRSCEASWAL